jgi:hypothetical protein
MSPSRAGSRPSPSQLFDRCGAAVLNLLAEDPPLPNTTRPCGRSPALLNLNCRIPFRRATSSRRVRFPVQSHGFAAGAEGGAQRRSCSSAARRTSSGARTATLCCRRRRCPGPRRRSSLGGGLQTTSCVHGYRDASADRRSSMTWPGQPGRCAGTASGKPEAKIDARRARGGGPRRGAGIGRDHRAHGRLPGADHRGSAAEVCAAVPCGFCSRRTPRQVSLAESRVLRDARQGAGAGVVGGLRVARCVLSVSFSSVFLTAMQAYTCCRPPTRP